MRGRKHDQRGVRFLGSLERGIVSLAWAHVVCSSCGRRYRCTPADDYYNATTAEDGVCLTCLVDQGEWTDRELIAKPPAIVYRFEGRRRE